MGFRAFRILSRTLVEPLARPYSKSKKRKGTRDIAQDQPQAAGSSLRKCHSSAARLGSLGHTDIYVLVLVVQGSGFRIDMQSWMNCLRRYRTPPVWGWTDASLGHTDILVLVVQGSRFRIDMQSWMELSSEVSNTSNMQEALNIKLEAPQPQTLKPQAPKTPTPKP